MEESLYVFYEFSSKKTPRNVLRNLKQKMCEDHTVSSHCVYLQSLHCVELGSFHCSSVCTYTFPLCENSCSVDKRILIRDEFTGLFVKMQY